RIIRFAGAGAAAAATHVRVAPALTGREGLPVLTSNGLAFTVAVLLSYIGNHSWTFLRAGSHDRHLPRFLVVSLAGLALNQSIVFTTVTLAGFPYIVGILIVIVVVPTLTFLLSRSWAFIDFKACAGFTKAKARKSP